MSVADDYNVYEVPQCVMIREAEPFPTRTAGLPDERSLAYMVERGMDRDFRLVPAPMAENGKSRSLREKA